MSENPQSRRPTPLGELPSRARIVEVGPRDGLQAEARIVPTEAKLAFIRALADAGFDCVESTAFVHPKKVPQMADAEELYRALRPHRREGVRYPALVPSEKGLERALAVECREIAIFTAASDGFNVKNIGRPVDQSLREYGPLVARARAEGMWVRGYASTAFGCPYDGVVAPAQAARVVRALFDMGCEEVSVGDTIGVAHPAQVVEVTGALADAGVALDRVAMHFHDTRGMSVANVLTALELGVTTFDASAGGTGGCPFAPGAAGNLATEDVLYLLDGLGVQTGVDAQKVAAATAAIAGHLGHEPTGRAYNATRAARPAPVRWPIRVGGEGQ